LAKLDDRDDTQITILRLADGVVDNIDIFGLVAVESVLGDQ
jgi:hypothetical protein